ncbi:MAG TPA: FIST N-terminal domain-containing protein [Candidatus Methylacidiphilales bacterium]
MSSTPPAAGASRLHSGPYDEDAVRRVAKEAREELGGEPTLGLVFVTPDYIPDIADFLEVVRLHARIPVLVGASGHSLLGVGEEMEGGSGFSLLLLRLPGTVAKAFHIPASALKETGEIDEDAEDGPDEEADAEAASGWRRLAAKEMGGTEAKAWLALLDPFDFPVERWLRQWNAAFPGLPVFGGLASGPKTPGAAPGSAGPIANEAWVFLDGKVVDGAVLVGFGGQVAIRTLVSQGCKPIGEPCIITGADQNILYTLGSQPAYKILDGAFQSLTDAEKEKARGHLFAGLAMSEYVDEFKRGDFLVRSILGADPNTGAVAIAAHPRVGQTLQYQLRDAEAASEDLREALEREAADPKVAARPPVAAFVCTCTGRGRSLFAGDSHDARAVAAAFPGLPVAGFFANGEIGPVGSQSHIHGYSASIAFFAAPQA